MQSSLLAKCAWKVAFDIPARAAIEVAVAPT
jgi:hypothetical protein